MKRRLLLFIVTIGAVLLLWALFGGSKPRFTLADGTTVAFHGVSVGASNRYCFGNPVRRVAAKLPWSWAQKFAAGTVLTAPVDRNTNLVLWVTYRGMPPKVRAGEPFLFNCIHDAGTDLLQFNSFIREGLPSGEAAACFYTSFWPRRSKRLTLQALETNATSAANPLWEIRVSNPLQIDYPQWQPEALPACSTGDNVIACLEQIVPSNTPAPTMPYWLFPGVEWVRAQLRVTSRDQPDASWAICGAWFREPFGQRYELRLRLQSRSSGEIHELDFPLWLMSGERAGKLSVAIARMDVFPTNELFTLPEFELRAEGYRMEALRTNSPFGEIHFQVTAGRSSIEQQFEVRAERGLGSGGSAGTRWFEPFAATDDRGRSYRFAGYGPEVNIGWTVQRIQVPPDAKRLAVTVAAPRMMNFEFTVGPENINRPK